jgi:hypothetical protein
MYRAVGEALSNIPLLHDPSTGRALISPGTWLNNLPRHQAQINSPYHTEKASNQQSLTHWDNGEVENRHKWPKLEAGDHDGPKFLMTSDISHRWCTFAYILRIICHSMHRGRPEPEYPPLYSRGNAYPRFSSPRGRGPKDESFDGKDGAN